MLASIQLNAQLQITSGAEIKLSGAATLTLNDINLVNDGIFNQTDGTVFFTGNINTTINGSQSTRFYNMDIAKGPLNRVTLQRSINTGNQLNFTAGYLDLNGFNIALDPTAVLNGETETKRIVGSTGGEVTITVNLNAPSSVNPGNLGAIFTSAANMGSTIIQRGHALQNNVSGSASSIRRYFDITPTNNTALNATLRMHYFDAEIGTQNENIFNFFRKPVIGSWSNQGVTTRNTVLNYAELQGIAAFSRWTLSDGNIALPVLFVLFNVKCNNGKADIIWKTASEQNSSHFEVQRSVDGNSWTNIGTVPAAGNSSTERSYAYTDNNPLPTAFYRIAEFDLDGRTQYTSIIKNDCGQTDSWKVWPNPVQDQLFVGINSAVATKVTISLYDAKGSLIRQQQNAILPGSNQLSVDMSRLPKGMYQVVANWNNGQQQQ
ncbi:MAG: T9SS type A sorting domain-containing protein, partial [Bacteroidetes bacterium]|nr:T9SS type A sorting domain-containing protein [Bacteroidota bacterium]